MLAAAVCLATTIAGATSAFAQARNYPESYLRYAGDPTQETNPAHQMPGILKDVSFRQQLNEQLPLDAAFKDEAGRDVRLGDYFKTGKPVVLAFVYYQCTMLCTQVMNGLSSALNVLSLEPGRDFEIVTVSFNPHDTPETARTKKTVYMDRYKNPRAPAAWHFLSGDEPSIARLTTAAGFRYAWDADTKQYAHPTGVIVLTPDGRLARYLFGIEYGPRDLRYALVEASDGRVGTVVDSLVLYCYHYDPLTGRYGLVIMRMIRVAAAATVLALGGFIFLMVRKDKRAAAVS